MSKKQSIDRDDCPTCRGMGWIRAPYAFRIKCLKCGNDFQTSDVDVQMSVMESKNNKNKQPKTEVKIDEMD